MKFLLPPRIAIHLSNDFLRNRYTDEKTNDSIIPINENIYKSRSLLK